MDQNLRLRAALNEMTEKREAAKLRIDCPGNPAFGAEGLLELDDSWPSFMRGTWSIDKVTASGSRQQSYRCTIEATYPDGRQE